MALDRQSPVPEASSLWCYTHSQEMVTNSGTLLQEVIRINWLSEGSKYHLVH